MALGVVLGIYTGILLSAFGARPLWNSAVLGLLFLISGLSSAAAFVHMVAKDHGNGGCLRKRTTLSSALELVSSSALPHRAGELARACTSRPQS